MSYVEMIKTSSFILFTAGMITMPLLSSAAQDSLDQVAGKTKPRRTDTYILSTAWNTVAFWRKEKSRPRMHYLDGTPPPPLQIKPFPQNWDESANIAALTVKNLPINENNRDARIPSYSGFLANLKTLEEATGLDADTGSRDLDSELNDGESEAVDEGPDTAAQVYPFEENEPGDEDPLDSSNQENGFSSDLESVFPRPYEQFVSGERLLMFFPVDHPSLDNWGASPLMLPVDTSIIFHPPNANLPRSSATIRKEY